MRVYLDNAATTPLAPEVAETMIPLLKNQFGNPSSTHLLGRQSKAVIETARRTISQYLNCLPSELIFTSGGTEADNMTLLTAVYKLGVKHIITSQMEHHAIGHTAEFIDHLFNDVKISFVKLDEKGNVDLDDLERLLKENPVKTLVSLMHANNEISTLLPLKKVREITNKYRALFHSDTVQTMGHYAFDLKELDLDFITCAAHKFHGPKGVGFLYVNNRNGVEPLIHGGGQERGHRAGTENIYGIAGLAKAIELAYTDLQSHIHHVQQLKTNMMKAVQEKIEDIYFIGETNPEKSLYTVLNISFPKTSKTEMLLFTLDLKGVCASGGSACSAGANIGSHVLDAIGYDHERPNVRFSFSRYTTQEEIDYTVKQLVEIFEKTLA